MSTRWYVKIDGKQYGPVSAAQLKQLAGKGKIEPTTPIRQETDGEWVAAGRVKALFAPPAAANPTATADAAVSKTKPPQVHTSSQSPIAVDAGVSPTAESRSKTVRLIWIAAAGGVLTLLLLAGVIVLATFAFVSWRRSATPGWRPTSAEESLAAMRIKNLGGKLYPNTKRPGVVMIYLDKTPATDEDLQQIQCINGIEILGLSSTQITDDGMRHLGKLKRLYMLVLDDTQITDAGLAHLYRLQSLKKLCLDSTSITDAGLVHLSRLTGLEELRLRDTQVTGGGVKKLQQALPECRILVTAPLAGLSGADRQDVDSSGESSEDTEPDELTREKVLAEIKKFRGGFRVDKTSPGQPVISVDLFVEEVGDKDLVLLKGLRKLQRLRLNYTKVTDAGLVHLAGLTNLKELYLVETNITGTGLEHLKRMTNLQSLWLADTQVTDAGLEHVKAFVRLQTLSLESVPVTDAGLLHLKGLTGLENLCLRGTRITDTGLEHLREMTQLRDLDLAWTRVSNEEVATLQLALPNCKIRR